MDESDRSYSIESQNTLNGHPHEDISEEFAKHFSIDNDDDDIVLLDQSEVIFNEVKILLDHLLTKIQIRENHSSQIRHCRPKRPLQLNNEEQGLLNKKVRFNIPDEQPSPTYLFVSETLQSTQSSKPYAQFLYHLGFDLCLEQNLNDNDQLSETDREILIQRNQNFHQYPTYSCKYCSFQTNTIHAMDYHYRTPHLYHNDKYRCTYCTFRTFHLSELRRHLHKKHHYVLISEPSFRRYQCTFCSYETDERNHFFKHNKRCQIEQTRVCSANNLLAPFDQMKRTIHAPLVPIKPRPMAKNNQLLTKTMVGEKIRLNESTEKNDIIEPIIIESDHDSSSLSRSSSSDEDFIVSSDEESASDGDNENINNKDLEKPRSLPTKTTTTPQVSSKSFVPPSTPVSVVQAATALPSLSKLLLLNGSPMPSFTSTPYNSNKSSHIPIQPKPMSGTDVYQMCNICQCYIFKTDYAKHMTEKHNNPSATVSTPIIILNTQGTTSNTSITCVKPTLILSQNTSQSAATIFLLSTSTMDTQLTSLNMIKCPWCDTNFEHIDIMTGHLMRYHRMTLAAAKVVVAEQMKIQGTSSNQLSLMFKLEIEEIQKEFTDKIYWKISQPKVYLHQMENLSCFVCHTNIDDVENHFLTSHQIQLSTMNTIKQCCLCGFHCDLKTSSLFEHQLRTHAGVCYSSILKQFIRFEPPPSPLSKTISTKTNRLMLPASSTQGGRVLITQTDKKFGCRKCDTNSGLFTFEELVDHLRSSHQLTVKLHRRCPICQQTYLKGREYNQHCLEHLNAEHPSIKLPRHLKI